MAKAKTPTKGSDKPAQSSKSRASTAASKPGASAKAPVKPAATPKAGVPKTAAAKSPQNVTTSVAPDAKKDVVPASDPTKTSTAKPDVISETTAKPIAGTIPKEAGKPSETDQKPDTSKPADAKQADPVKSDKPAAAASPKPEVSKPVPVAPAPAPEKSGSVFWPMLLGGVIAGGIGFAAAEMNVFDLRDAPVTVPVADMPFSDDLAALNVRITDLEQASSAGFTPSDAAASDEALESLQATLAELTARVDEIANRPAPEAPAPAEVDTSAFEAELSALKTSVETQRDEIEELLASARTVEEATADAARIAAQQSAVARIVSAIDTGEPFADAVSELQTAGTDDIPPALIDSAETGVTTSANLQDRFTSVARAALAGARADAPADAEGGLGGFLKRQLGARSVAPREGNDPDAVLSRAEAAVRDGRLTDALTEIEALPDSAKAPMADWLSDAQTRQAAKDAVQTLTQRLTAN